MKNFPVNISVARNESQWQQQHILALSVFLSDLWFLQSDHWRLVERERWSTQKWIVTVEVLLERSRAIQRVFHVTSSLTRTSGRELLSYCALWRLKCIETSLWSIRAGTEHCVAAICEDVLQWMMSSDRLETRLQKWSLGHLKSDVSKRCWLQLNLLSLMHMSI